MTEEQPRKPEQSSDNMSPEAHPKLTYADAVEKLADQAVDDIGDIISDASMLNRRTETKIIILGAFSKLLGLTKETLTDRKH